MNKIKEYRDRLKVLRMERKALVTEIKAKRARKKEIEAEMVLLRADIKREKREKGGVTGRQADQTFAQKQNS